MKVRVEFFGLASQLCGTKEVNISVEEETTLEQVLLELSSKFPTLVGAIIDKNNKTLLHDYILSIDGRYSPGSLKDKVYDGECLLIMPLLGGG